MLLFLVVISLGCRRLKRTDLLWWQRVYAGTTRTTCLLTELGGSAVALSPPFSPQSQESFAILGRMKQLDFN